MHHVGKFYTLESADISKIDPFQESLSKEFYAEVTNLAFSHQLTIQHLTHFSTQSKAFQETNLMIRKPAVEIISYLKNLDLTKPAVRFILCKTWLQQFNSP